MGIMLRYFYTGQAHGKQNPMFDPIKYTNSHWKEIVLSVLLLVIAKAFKKGSKLQKEQELTI